MTMAKSRYLDVFIAGSHAGELRMSSDGLLSFVYDRAYSGPDISVCMPFSAQEYSDRRVSAWFDNVLPDNGDVRKGMAASAGVAPGIFSLLTQFGLDLPGAVQVVAPDALDAVVGRGRGYAAISPERVGQRLREIVSSERNNLPRSWTCQNEHWSLGGMQTKLALREYRGQWYECLGSSASNAIVKPGVWDLAGQALDECITMRLAKRCGLPVADARIGSFDGIEAIIVKRYDRFTSEDGAVRRIHQEDLCQATATAPMQKYATDGGPSSADVMQLLGTAGDESAKRFVDALIFNYLTASTDAHAKNYSLLHPARGDFTLAPLYDVASIAPYMDKGKIYRLAMSMGGENRVGWLRKSSVARFAKLHCMDADAVSFRIEAMAELIKSNLEPAVEDFSRCRGADELVSRMIPRIRALCNATQRNIRVESDQFEPVDISRFV